MASDNQNSEYPSPVKVVLSFAIFPVSLLLLTVLFGVTWRFLELPSSNQLVEKAREFYSVYGYWIVFVGALAEGLLVAGWYLPGSVVIVLGVAFNYGHPYKAAAVVLIVILAFTLTTVINFGLGRYGWYTLLLRLGLETPLEKMRLKLLKHGLPLIFFTYLHPNLGCLTATSCGILRLSFRRFVLYSIVALVLWNSLWGFLAYFIGPQFLKLLNMKYFVIAVVLLLLVRIVQGLRATRSTTQSNVLEERHERRNGYQ